MQLLLGEQNPPCLGNRNRRRAEVLLEQPPKLPLPHAQPSGQVFNAPVIHRPHLNQHQPPRDCVGRPPPSAKIRRGLRPATQTWPESGLLRRGGGGVKNNIFRARRPCRADWAAIDSGRFNASEKPPVKAGITGANGAVTGVMVEVHTPVMVLRGPLVSRFSDS